MTWLDTLGGITASALEAMTPLLLAATGGLFTELAGMLNIALEGLMLAGAFFGFAAAAVSGSLLLGILAGALASSLIAWIYGSATLRLKANVFITGLAANIFAPSVTAVLSAAWFGTRSVVALAVPEPARPLQTSLGRIPVLGRVFFFPTQSRLPFLGPRRGCGRHYLPLGSGNEDPGHRREGGSRGRGWFQAGFLQVVGDHNLGIFLRHRRGVSLASPGSLCAQHEFRQGVDRPGRHISGEPPSRQDGPGLFCFRPGGELFQLCPRPVRNPQRIHPGDSLRSDPYRALPRHIGQERIRTRGENHFTEYRTVRAGSEFARTPDRRNGRVRP